MLKSLHSYLIKELKKQSGFSLMEVVIIILIIGVAMIPLSRATISNLQMGGKQSLATQSMFYAKERMEEIVADCAADDAGRGYSWTISNWDGDSDTPATGFTRTVDISAESTIDSVDYVIATVTVAYSGIENVSLRTWLIEP